MRIKELREQFNLSQEDLAKEVDTSQRNIGRWENGENQPAYFQLVKLSDFFGCSLDFLVGRSDEFGAVNVAGEELSKDEKELLRSYRALDFDSQNVIRIQLKALVESKA